MTDTKQLSDTARTQTIELVKQSQEVALQAVQAWANAVDGFVPDSTGYRAFAERLPRPVEAVDQAFELTEQLLAVQREFVHNLFDAATPAVAAAQRTVEDAPTGGKKRK